MKAVKVALHKDIITTKKYIKDVQICIGEVQEYILKKKDECVLHGILTFINILYYQVYNILNVFFFVFL